MTAMIAAAGLPGSSPVALPVALPVAGPTVAGAQGQRLAVRGANLVETSNAPFGSHAAARSLGQLAQTGANWVAIIPFFWQPGPNDPGLVAGDALPPERLRAAIRQAHDAGLGVLVKPHVWVPQTWAGAITMQDEAGWQAWFAAYRAALLQTARIAQEENASALSIGTELRGTSQRGEWAQIIAEARQVFSGMLTYVAQGSGEAEQIPFWPLLDAVSPSLYPELGGPDDQVQWGRAMAGELVRLRALAHRHGKPLWLAEVGIRSASDASWKPWESAEERAAGVDMALQAEVLAQWLEQAARHQAQGLFVWRWFTDPDAGGPADTDFTIQNKTAQTVLAQAWLRS